MSGVRRAAVGAALGAAVAAGAAPAARPEPRRTRLSLVPPLRTGAPRAPFVLLLSTLLAGGLAGVLFLHTALAENSFRLQDLQARSAVLTDREQVLQQQIAREASPRRLAERAERLGMVRSVNPAFLRLSDGKILGKPRPGVAPPAPVTTPATPAGEQRPSEAGQDRRGRNGGRDSDRHDSRRDDRG